MQRWERSNWDLCCFTYVHMFTVFAWSFINHTLLSWGYCVFHSEKHVGRSEHGVNFQRATDLCSFHLASFPGLILLWTQMEVKTGEASEQGYLPSVMFSCLVACTSLVQVQVFSYCELGKPLAQTTCCRHSKSCLLSLLRQILFALSPMALDYSRQRALVGVDVPGTSPVCCSKHWSVGWGAIFTGTSSNKVLRFISS